MWEEFFSENAIKIDFQKLIALFLESVVTDRFKNVKNPFHIPPANFRSFPIMDDNENRKLSYDEFKKGLADFGITWDEGAVSSAFKQLDKNSCGTINFDEFLIAL